VLERWNRRGPGGWAGLQVDFDVATRRLPAYAAWLARLRRRLGPHRELSCTALVDWLRVPAFDRVAAAVDCVVPQLYNLGAPADPLAAERFVGGGDLPAILARLRACGGDFLVGLPSYEQCLVYGPDGKLVHPALPLDLASAWNAGWDLHARRTGPEQVFTWRTRREHDLGRAVLPPGSLVVLARPTVATLAAQLALVREEGGPRCRGACFFRLAGGPPGAVLTTGQLRAAWEGEAPDERVEIGFERGDDGYHLRLIHVGTRDRADPARPWILPLNGFLADARCVDPAGLWSVVPALGERPASPARADGVLVTVPLLRAGEELVVGPLMPAAGFEATVTDGEVR